MKWKEIGIIIGVLTGVVSLLGITYTAGYKVAQLESTIENLSNHKANSDEFKKLDDRVQTLWDFFIKSSLDERERNAGQFNQSQSNSMAPRHFDPKFAIQRLNNFENQTVTSNLEQNYTNSISQNYHLIAFQSNRTTKGEITIPIDILRVIYRITKGSFDKEVSSIVSLIIQELAANQKAEMNAYIKAFNLSIADFIDLVALKVKNSKDTIKLLSRLESDDLNTRRRARIEFLRLGTASSLPLENVLSDSQSNTRLLIETLIILNMEDMNDVVLSLAALASIVEKTGHSNRTLRTLAQQYIEKHPSRGLEVVLDKALFAASSKINSEGLKTLGVIELAKIEFELICKLGVLEREKYMTGRLKNRVYIEKSISDFEKAWELRLFVSKENWFGFLEALYECGISLHARSLSERSTDGTRDTELIEASKRKFGEFLRELPKAMREANDSNLYPNYREHVEHATAYLQNS